jgi:outer membrane lipoprotein carrier protein
MRKVPSLAPLLALWLLAVPAPAEAGQAEDLLSSFQQWLDATRDLSGQFEQELLSGAMGTGIEESGRWFLRRPGQLRFDYLRPENKVALVNGVETLLWIEADDYAERGTLDSQNNLLMALLTAEQPLEEFFEAGIDVEPVRRGHTRLRLVPIEQDDALTELILTLPLDGEGLAAVEVLDASGNRIFYRFSGLRRNRGVSAELFDFTPPGN